MGWFCFYGMPIGMVLLLLCWRSQVYLALCAHADNQLRLEEHVMMQVPSCGCVARRFRHCANVIVCTYTNLANIEYYTPSLYGIASHS